ESLAVFLGDDARDLVNVFFEQHLQFEERLDAIFWWGAAPVGVCGSSSVDGLRGLGSIRERDLGDHLSYGRVDDVGEVFGGGVEPLAVNELRDFGLGEDGGVHDMASAIVKNVRRLAQPLKGLQKKNLCGNAKAAP